MKNWQGKQYINEYAAIAEFNEYLDTKQSYPLSFIKNLKQKSELSEVLNDCSASHIIKVLNKNKYEELFQEWLQDNNFFIEAFENGD